MKKIRRGLAAAACITMLCGNVLASPIAMPAQNDMTFNGAAASMTASGEKFHEGALYTIEKDFVLNLENAKADFNQFSLTYSSTQPLRCEITYSNSGVQGTEEFYLEAGENLTFSQLIDGYLEGKTQNQIHSIRFSIIANVRAVLTVDAINTSMREVLDTQVAYLENENYKVGINLAWGGGVSYLEDKNDGDESITNLLNHYDTGRLVQQSYYGTSEAPYEVGEFMGNEWSYNPVQGGDKANNPSKLVDFQVEDNAIYIKARPMDWGHDGKYTHVYMENEYTLHDDGVEVYNSVIDFSNYNNPIRDQELPAFYTISHLGTFYYYGGDKPWTGDTLTKLENLPFWAGNADAYKEYSPGNTETWMAWVNENDWGVGLYVPNVDLLLTGRYNFDGSKDPAAVSTSYVAPLRHMMLTFGEKIEYSYYIGTGTVEELRDQFTEIKDTFTQNESLDQEDIYTDITFEGLFGQRLFTTLNECALTFENGYAVLTAQNLGVNDPYATMNLTGCDASLKAEEHPYIVLTYLAPKTNSEHAKTGDLFFGAGNTATPTAEAFQSFDVISDGKLHSAIIDLSNHGHWQGKPNFLRLDFFSQAAEGDQMYLKSVHMAATIEEAQAIAREEENSQHILYHAAASDATCTEDGNSEYWYCADCGKYFSDAEATTEIIKEATIVEAQGHTYEWAYDANQHWKVCSVCHAVDESTKAEHNWTGDTCECGASRSTQPYDLNGDGEVNLLDILMAQKHFGAKAGEADWTEATKCDVVPNDQIDLQDLIAIVMYYTL